MFTSPLRFALSCAALAAALGAEARAVQDTIRVSVDSAGAEGNFGSWNIGISTDGRFVVFQSWASNLVASDKNNSGDVFLFDRATATIERVSVDSAGKELNGTSIVETLQIVSDDGSRIAFGTDAPIDPNDTNGFHDLYVRDRVAGTTTRASVDSSGNQANYPCYYGALSQDGRCVAFFSYATNLVAGDTNRKADVFVHDLATGMTERVSVDSSGVEGDRDSNGASISADGTFVAFWSSSRNLVPGDTNFSSDVFVRDRAGVTTERVSVDSNGQEGDESSMDPSISADGRFVAFKSWSTNLVAGDTNSVVDIFVRDRGTGTTTRVSVDSSGQEGDKDSFEPAISADGRFVLFTSEATNLVPGDTNSIIDVFLHDRSNATTIRVSVDSSGAQSNHVSLTGGVSASGAASFQSYASNLVASDTNGRGDAFVRDECGAYANWTNYGSGFPGTHGVPAFTAQQFPSFGATVTIDLANSWGQPTIGLLVLGLQRGSFKTKFGGDLLVVPLVIAPITFSYGGDSFTGTIPDDVALCGVSIDLQGIENDPGAAHGLSFSAGLELVIGN
jgi:hypothetical protein